MFRCRFVATALLLFFTGGVQGGDLSIVDAQVLKVGPCSHQLRFGVRYDGGNDSAAVNYRVGVYSASRKSRLHAVEIREQKPGTTHFVIVPPDMLVCDSSIEVRVDDREQVAENDRKNNVIRETWQPPNRNGFCMSQLDKCP